MAYPSAGDVIELLDPPADPFLHEVWSAGFRLRVLTIDTASDRCTGVGLGHTVEDWSMGEFPLSAFAWAPISQPAFTKLCSACGFSNTHTSLNFFTPKPRPACTSSIFMYVRLPVFLSTATPAPLPLPARRIFTPKLLNTAYPAAFA